MIDAIFREYDIRGIAVTEITEDDVELIGRGIGTFLSRQGCRRLTVGRDCRLTGDVFSERLIAGLTASGCHVTDIGVCPTPVLYFSIHHLGQEGGVMATASFACLPYFLNMTLTPCPPNGRPSLPTHRASRAAASARRASSAGRACST